MTIDHINALYEEHHPGESVQDMGYVRWPEIDELAGILVGIKAPYITALLNEWPSLYARLKAAEELGEDVETERAILAARNDPNSQHVAVALRAALTKWRDAK